MMLTCHAARLPYADITLCLNFIGFLFFQFQLASARAPLQAKIEDMEDVMQHLQDKLDKVKAENDRVRFLFS